MNEKFVCEFCKKEYNRERTLINHLCEPKRRWMQKDEKPIRLAFNSWLRWYELTNTNKHKKTRTYSDFMKSKEYIGFVRFGRHVANTKMIQPSQFIDFVIKQNLKLKDWTKDSVFELYVQQNCRQEDVTTALERFVKLTEAWANENNQEWTDFFKLVNCSVALHWIRVGQLSPWILMCSDTVKHLWSRMTDEQIKYVDKCVDLQLWQGKIAKNKKDTAFVKQILKEYGI